MKPIHDGFSSFRRTGKVRSSHRARLAAASIILASTGLLMTTTSLVSSSSAGAAAVKPGQPITIAVLNDDSGSLGESFGAIATAQIAWAKYINSIGGIDGHQINLKSYDDAGSSTQTLANAKSAVAAGAIGITATEEYFDAAAPYLLSSGVPVAGVGLSAGFYGASKTNFFGLEGDAQVPGSSDGWENYFISKGIKKIAIVTNNVPVYQTGGAAEAAHFKKAGGSVVYFDNSFSEGNSSELLSIAAKIVASGAQGAIGNIYEGAQLQVDVYNAGGHNIPVVSGSEIANNFPQQYGKAVYPYIYVSVTTPPYDTAVPAIQQYLTGMKKYAAADVYSPEAQTGWDSDAFLAYGINAVIKSGKPLTAQNVTAYLNTLKNNTINGLTAPLTFPRDHGQSDGGCDAYVGINSAGQWHLVAGTPTNPYICGE